MRSTEMDADTSGSSAEGPVADAHGLPVPAGVVGDDGTMLAANDALAQLTGRQLGKELAGVPASSAFADPGAFDRWWRTVRDAAGPQHVRALVAVRGGHPTPAIVYLLASASHDEPRRVLMVLPAPASGGRPAPPAPEDDLSAALHENREWARAVTQAADGAGIGLSITTLGPEGRRLAFINGSGARMFGRPVEDLVGGPPVPAIPPDVAETLRARRSEPEATHRVPLLVPIEVPGRPPIELEVGISHGTYWGLPAQFTFFRDVTERRANERRLGEAEAAQRALVQAADRVGIGLYVAVTDEDSTERLAYANTTATHLLGLRPDEVEGAPAPALAGRMARGQRWAVHPNSIETYVVRPDGSRVPVVVGRANGLFQGRPARIVFLQDAAERRRAEAQKMEIEVLKRVSDFRRDLLNAAAHEFNTPLTPMRIQLHLLHDGHHGPLTDRQRESIEKLEANLDRFATAVRDTVELAGIDAPNGHTEARPLDVGVAAAATVDRFRPPHGQPGPDVVLEATEGLVVMAPTRWLDRILATLVGNAVSLTGPGGRVTVRTAQRRRFVVVSVDDTGPGLSREQLEHVFEPFTEVHDELEQGRQGVGLSLHMARRMARGLGGDVVAKSEGPGRGARFVLRLPVMAPDDAAVPQATEALEVGRAGA